MNEEQGILEDTDSDYCGSADSTGNFAGCDQLFVEAKALTGDFPVSAFYC